MASPHLCGFLARFSSTDAAFKAALIPMTGFNTIKTDQYVTGGKEYGRFLRKA